MKVLIFFFLFSFLSHVSFSQTKDDYVRIMELFVGYYNSEQPNEINKQFDVNRNFYTKEKITYLKKKYGKIISFKYACAVPLSVDPNNITLFKVISKKSTFMSAFSLDKNLKFGTHRFATSSPYIDSILATIK